MLLVLISLGFIYWAVGPGGRENITVILVVLVVLWLFAADRLPKAPEPPSLAIALYDDLGRPKSKGKVLVIPKVIPTHPH
jgi:hypothetical protein